MSLSTNGEQHSTPTVVEPAHFDINGSTEVYMSPQMKHRIYAAHVEADAPEGGRERADSAFGVAASGSATNPDATPTSSSLVLPNKSLPWSTVTCYSVGHFLNDACASCWFSYLLLYLQDVQGLSGLQSGVVLFSGQLFDALATPIVGLLSDRSAGLPALGLGRRKFWNLIGVAIVMVCFFFVFGLCLPCVLQPNSAVSALAKTVSFSVFASAFNVGWAAVQVSHMAMVPELTNREGERVLLNSMRYGATILANVFVFVVMWVVLHFRDGGAGGGNVNSSDTYTIVTYAVLGLGGALSVMFLVGTPESPAAPLMAKALDADAAGEPMVAYASLLLEGGEDETGGDSAASSSSYSALGAAGVPAAAGKLANGRVAAAANGAAAAPPPAAGAPTSGSHPGTLSAPLSIRVTPAGSLPLSPEALHREALHRVRTSSATSASPAAGGASAASSSSGASAGPPQALLDVGGTTRRRGPGARGAGSPGLSINTAGPGFGSDGVAGPNSRGSPPPPEIQASLSYVWEEGRLQHMQWRDWLRLSSFWKTAGVYMATRLAVNVSQVYLSFYVTLTLELDQTAIAIVPLMVYVASLGSTGVMKYISGTFGRFWALVIGGLLFNAGCVAMFFLRSGPSAVLVYPAVVLLGAGSAIAMVISVSMEADLVGTNTESGAFVYGAMSFTDKLSNGVVIVVIQVLQDSLEGDFQRPEFIRYVNALVPAAAMVLAMAVAATMAFPATLQGSQSFRDSMQSLKQGLRRRSPAAGGAQHGSPPTSGSSASERYGMGGGADGGGGGSSRGPSAVSAGADFASPASARKGDALSVPLLMADDLSEA